MIHFVNTIIIIHCQCVGLSPFDCVGLSRFGRQSSGLHCVVFSAMAGDVVAVNFAGNAFACKVLPYNVRCLLRNVLAV